MFVHSTKNLLTKSLNLTRNLRGNFCTTDTPPPTKFKTQGATALITGGAGGIGLACGKALLKAGAKGISIADVNEEKGHKALAEIHEQFGDNKAIFTKCDVTRSALVDWAFKNTLKAYERIDLVINNAGVHNDQQWETSINTNIGGYIVGTLLGLQYMSKGCRGSGGVVVNIGSTLGLSPLCGCPIYSMTQAAIIGLTRSLGKGKHTARTGVMVMGLCAGLTDTELLKNAPALAINERFSKEFMDEVDGAPLQDATLIAQALLELLENSDPGAIWVAECNQPPYKMKFIDHACMKDSTPSTPPKATTMKDSASTAPIGAVPIGSAPAPPTSCPPTQGGGAKPVVKAAAASQQQIQPESCRSTVDLNVGI